MSDIDQKELLNGDYERSEYNPEGLELEMRDKILKDFYIGTINQWTPRVEFNDLSLIERDQYDQQLWNTYQPNNGAAPIYDNIQGWRCLSEDTEILTTSGWFGIGDIKAGDAVLSYDKDSGSILPDTVKEYFEYDVDGEMVSIKNKHTDQLITSNHRTLVKKWERTTVDGKRIRTWWPTYEYVEAKDLDYSVYDFPLAGLYDGETSIGEDWAELIGWFLTDGCMLKGPYYITQSKPDTLLKLRALLDSMGVEYREWSRPKKDKEGNFGHYFDEHRFYFAKDSEVCKMMDKWIPNRKPTNDLLHIKLIEKNRLLLGLCLGDGSFDKEYNHYVAIHKPYEDFKEWVTTLLHLMGLVGTNSDRYVSIRYSPSTQIGSEDRATVDYYGKVWSISTERTNYIARRNGKIFITGNSNAMRPIVRNKAISILAHTMAELVFPKINAYNNQSDTQADAAQAMEDLMEWASDKSDYAMYELRRGMAALNSPASIGYTEYAETYRKVKRIKDDGGWEWDTMLDPIYSGFQNVCVPVDELLIENFYENDIQKQGFLIWRKVIPYTQARAKYSSLYENFNKYVQPGCQVMYNDANQGFYNVYDANLRQYDVEEVMYWNKELDVKLILVNGVLLTDAENPNPRLDKLYPFDKYGWQLINNRCFYYKDLSFSLQQDANILNTLYPMVVDGTYLNLFPPTYTNGGEVIGSDVMVPGANVTLSSPNSVLQAIKPPSPLADGMNTLAKIESSLSESSQDTLQAGQEGQGGQDMTAYQLSIMQANAATVLGLFRQMRAQHVKEFGELRLGDIIQYLTIPEINEIIGDSKLVYKAFVLHDKQSGGSSKTRKLKFNPELPDEMDSDEHLEHSLRLLQDEGGVDAKNEIYEINPSKFRALKFELQVTPDTMNPKSQQLLRAFRIDLFDRMVSSPPGLFDPEETARILLSSDDDTRKDPDKYLAKTLNAPPLPGMQMPQQTAGGPPSPQPLGNQMSTLQSPQMQ